MRAILQASDEYAKIALVFTIHENDLLKKQRWLN
jgi:hypothetical protein